MSNVWYNNRYLAMRHGQSTANPLRKVVSWPEHGVNGFGLTELGKEQVHSSVMAMNEVMILEDLNWKEKLVIVSSDFLRTRETAELTAEILNYQEDIIWDARLRERFFGEDEFIESYKYELIAAQDLINSDYSERGIESANQIKARVTAVMEDLNKNFADKIILIISHGDVLQVLQTAFLDISPGMHHEIPYIANAEVRELLHEAT